MGKVEIIYQGKQAWKHEDGSIRDSKGRMMKPMNEPFDSDSGRQAAEDRWEQTRQAVDAGMAEGLEVSKPADAVRRMAGVQAKIAHDPDNPRAVTAFNSLLTASQRVPSQRQQSSRQAGLSLSMDAGAVEALAGLLGQLSAGRAGPPSVLTGEAGEIVDAEVRETGT